MATLTTVDNFNSFNIELKQEGKGFQLGDENYFLKSSVQKDIEIHLSFESYLKNRNNIFFSFFDKDEEKKLSKNSSDNLILSIVKSVDENNKVLYSAQSGNYIGKFKYNGHDIEIKSRFGDKFLERMLNFANDVYLDDISIVGETVKKDEIDYSKYIIYYLFVQTLEKAYLLGLPKSYTTIQHHEATLKGKININRFINSDIPFKGKISSVSREQKEIQEIIDVLYKVIKIIGKEPKQKNSISYKGFLKNISHIVPHLKEQRSNNFVSNETISKALKSKALQNPIFAPYKKVLRYAKYIINADSIKENNKGNQETFGFLVNVAELFEIYVTKLLQKEFSDWHVESPKIPLYETMFYSRKIIPDIVMTRGNDVMVFDTKYKRMKMKGKDQNGAGDVDRNDFFQINTYMSYYHNQGLHVKTGGLLYPIEKKFDSQQCYSDNWLGNSNTKFIIDGIDLSKNKENGLTMDDLKKSENAFINGLRELIQ